MSSIPGQSRSEPGHSFTGSKYGPDDDDYTEIEFLEEDFGEVSSSTARSSTSTQIEVDTTPSPRTPTPRTPTPRTTTSRTSVPNRRRKISHSSELVDFLKKDVKRQKKESKHFFALMRALGQAQNLNMPEYPPSDSSTDE